jgi:hypothetical protein
MEGTMSTAKQDVEQLLNKLPDDCSVEDIQYHLYVLDKIRRGLRRPCGWHDDAGTGGSPPQQMAHRMVWSRRAFQDLEAIAS